MSSFTLLVALLLGQVDYGIPVSKYVSSNGEIHIDYDPMTKNPRYVVEYLNAKVLTKAVSRDTNPFKADESLPKYVKVYPQDYISSGYDRGHMAPAGDHMSSKESFDYTFFMTNMSPQLPEVNRRVWNYLEASIREAIPRYDGGWVVTCPIYGGYEDSFTVSKVAKKIWVPTHFGKSVLFTKRIGDRANYTLHSFIVPNKVDVHVDYSMYRVTTDELENRTGLDLWTKFSVEDLESKP